MCMYIYIYLYYERIYYNISVICSEKNMQVCVRVCFNVYANTTETMIYVH